MGVLLGRLVAAQRAEQAAARNVPLGCMGRVLHSFGHRTPSRAPPTAPPIRRRAWSSSYRRELEILGLVAADTPNQPIADQLVVTLDTVKKHVTHLLGKLGAANTPRPSPARGCWA